MDQFFSPSLGHKEKTTNEGYPFFWVPPWCSIVLGSSALEGSRASFLAAMATEALKSAIAKIRTLFAGEAPVTPKAALEQSLQLLQDAGACTVMTHVHPKQVIPHRKNRWGDGLDATQTHVLLASIARQGWAESEAPVQKCSAAFEVSILAQTHFEPPGLIKRRSSPKI